MKIIIAAPEAVPYVKTGGLADVAGALCKELRKMGNEVHIMLPLYRKARRTAKSLKETAVSVRVPVGDRVVDGRIFADERENFFIACDDFFDREELYGIPEGDYEDNASRFVFFSRGVIEACKALEFKPDIIHCNDWQTALVPLYLKTLYGSDPFFKNTAILLTIHNLGYQGLFPEAEMPLTNLGWEYFTPEGIEFYGKVNFLKAGILASDALTTVSENYSKEILMRENGFGLEGLLKTREDDLYGVVNGIDYEEWNPSKDTYLASYYDSDKISGKASCKSDLIKSLFKGGGPETERIPLVCMVGRLSEQKGLDILFDAIHEILSFGVKLVILGKGDERFQEELLELQGRYKGGLSVTIGFDDSLAHRIYAGADFFLMPSRYEPCGLGQLISLRYGAIPVARRTGGLVDTIRDYDPLAGRGTGFLFADYTPSALLNALKRAFCVYTDKGKLRKMITEGMKEDFSWRRAAERYIEIYWKSLKEKKIRGIRRRGSDYPAPPKERRANRPDNDNRKNRVNRG
ncbi:MAG: glycogen synthase GlgA [Nitrospirota bacterium]